MEKAKQVIYIRGYQHVSGSNSNEDNVISTCETIRSIVATKGYELIVVEIDYNNLDDIKAKIEFILSVDKSNIDAIIGNSLGGLIAAYIRTLWTVKTILINPQVLPLTSRSIREIDRINVISFLETLAIVVRTERLKIAIDTKYYKFPPFDLVLLGAKDDITPFHGYFDDYYKVTSKTIIDGTQGHRFNNLNEYTNLILDVIELDKTRASYWN